MLNLDNESLKDEVSNLKKFIEKWTSNKVTLDQLLTEQVLGNIIRALGGCGKKETISSKDVLFTNGEKSPYKTSPDVTFDNKVFNVIREEMEETFHLTFNEVDEVITQTSTKGDGINFNANRSFHDDEFSVPRKTPTQCTGMMTVYLMYESSEFINYVCKLDKALYRLKQAPKAWDEALSKFLIEHKFLRGSIDNTLCIYKTKSDVKTVLIYLDGIIFRCQANSKESHLVAVKRIFTYLKGTPNLDRKSTSRVVKILGGKLVCWSAKKQNSMAMSSAEAGYVKASGAIAMLNNSVLHSRTKHIDIRRSKSKKTITRTYHAEEPVTTTDTTKGLDATESAAELANQPSTAATEKAKIDDDAKITFMGATYLDHIKEEADSNVESMLDEEIQSISGDDDKELGDSRNELFVVDKGPPPAGPSPPNNNGPPPVVRPNGLAPRSMEDLCQPSIHGRSGPIALIPIQAMDFRLRHHMIQQQNGVSNDTLRLSLFPYSLMHHATAWHRDTINVVAGGNFMQKTPEECYELIENMTAHHNHWNISVTHDETSRNISSTTTTESPEVVRQLEMINKIF
uniref:Uncharacterized mitochondrial protein AtMg00810-like n=1 Tax=Tanacetum cinerariifolium TaxID=118510 RepID=A0A6L2MLN9_TANCI|nr:uncharacterized mitochondrial protein AtMg00810-like [Tanacetum cinerariifolium]